jgi:hypothetical protein
MATATQGTAKTINEGSTIQALALTKLAGGSAGISQQAVAALRERIGMSTRSVSFIPMEED